MISNIGSKGRRRFLMGLGATAAALPFLRSFPVQAGGAAEPKLLIFMSPNGFLVGPHGDSYWGYEGWRPRGFPAEPAIGTSMRLEPGVLPEIFRPLERHRERLLFLEGLRQVETLLNHPDYGPVLSDPHLGAASMLTGVPVFIDRINGGYIDISGSGISVDQLLGQRLGFDPLVLACPLTGEHPNESFFSFRGPREPITPIQSPIDAFDRVFTGVAADRSARRAATLRFLDEDFGAVLRNAPAADRPRLEAHRDAVSRLGSELSRAACGAGGIVRPESYELDYGGNYIPRAMRDYADITVEALACGWTRVGYIQPPNSGGNFNAEWRDYGVPYTWDHSLAHGLAGDETLWEEQFTRAEAIAAAVALQVAYNDMFAYILDRLAERTDVDGRPMLDNTIVIHAKPAGQNHDWTRLLWVLAGGQNLGIRNGEFRVVGLQNQEPHCYYNDLWVSICQIMGATDIETFGEARFNRAPMDLT